jgi:5-formyltetrahydrofolate cyclo-ligase
MSAANLTELKRELRADLSARRASMAYDPDLADGIMRQLAELVSARASRRVACYLPFGNEPDTELFIDWAMDAGIEVLLPVSLASGELEWVLYEGETEPGIFGFAEPVGKAGSLDGVDLVIAPALAVDQNGNRLGKGKGYYDRALEGKNLPVVAVVYDDELLEAVPVEPHDQPVDAVVTPSQLVIFAGLK